MNRKVKGRQACFASQQHDCLSLPQCHSLIHPFQVLIHESSNPLVPAVDFAKQQSRIEYTFNALFVGDTPVTAKCDNCKHLVRQLISPLLLYRSIAFRLIVDQLHDLAIPLLDVVASWRWLRHALVLKECNDIFLVNLSKRTLNLKTTSSYLTKCIRRAGVDLTLKHMSNL